MNRNTLIITLVAVLVVVGVGSALFLGRTPSTTNEDDLLTNTETEFDLNESLNLDVTEDADATANVNEESEEAIAEDTNAEDIEEIFTIKDVTFTTSGFSPKTLTISVGDTVLWTNASDGPLYVAPDDHPSHTKYAGVWDDNGEGNIGSAEDYSFTFDTAGTYAYHNHLNTAQTGTIIVQEK